MTLAKKYRDQLVLALRAQEVSGDRVGEVLAEVETHVAETGEDPQEAFGPPRDYANHVVAQLGPATGKPHAARHAAGALATGALTYLGVSLLLETLFTNASAVVVTAADAVSWPVILVALVTGTVLLLRAAATPRRDKTYGIASGGAFAVAIVAGPVIDWLGDDQTPVLDMPPWTATTVGIAFLAGAAILLARNIKRGRITDPRHAAHR